MRRPLRAGLRRTGLPALERGRAPAAGAAGRPDLGGHQRDPAAGRRPRPRAPRRADHPPLTASMAPAPLLEPRSIAVVGANARPGSYGDIVLRNLARSGFEGEVWA